jgi:hypothetical protein
MKQIFGFASLALLLVGIAFAQQQTEEQCRRNVQTFLSGIEFAAQQKGIEPKLNDLSIKEILEIQRSKGSCMAEQQIKKRMLN